jgi:hypothetical protein
MRAAISLIADLNSLQGRKKFPVRMRRELAHNALIYCPFLLPFTPPRSLESRKFPVKSLLAGNFADFRDGFARDCLLQRRVSCEPDFLDRGAENIAERDSVTHYAQL